MKRAWIFVGIGFLLLGLFAWWYSHREWLTDGLLAQIKLGMKREQVEKLLGKPDDYQLGGYHDITSLRGISLTSPVFFTPSSTEPWGANYTSTDVFIHEAVNDERSANSPLKWIGRERALILFTSNGSDDVCEILAFSITKTGGGFFGWLSRKWDDWMQGK